MHVIHLFGSIWLSINKFYNCQPILLSCQQMQYVVLLLLFYKYSPVHNQDNIKYREHFSKVYSTIKTQ